jgi:hypothetical protein
MSGTYREILKRIPLKLAFHISVISLAFVLWSLILISSGLWPTIPFSFFIVGGIIFFSSLWILWIIIQELINSRFQYSLRTLFIVFTLVAFVLGLLINPVKQAYQHAKRFQAANLAMSVISKLKGGVRYAEGDKSHDLWEDIDCVYLSGSRCTNSDIKMLVAALRNLRIVHLENTLISDEVLEYLKNLKHLELVFLSGTNVTEKGINMLQSALPDCKIDMPTPAESKAKGVRENLPQHKE